MIVRIWIYFFVRSSGINCFIMTVKIIFVVSNHLELGTTGKKTGWYLPECAHPYEEVSNAGIEVVFISPKGGKAPMDESSGVAFKDDAICQKFLKNIGSKLDHTLTAKDVKASDFQALFFVGGHGPMFDMPNATDIAELAAAIYNNGGILSAVCHGPVGFCPIKIKGEPLVKGHTVTCFTNSEEDAMNLSSQMPFMLETRLVEQGAKFEKAADWQPCVKVSGRVITGQNPASATGVGQELVKALKK